MAFPSMDWMPHFLPMVGVVMAAAFTPGPNNIMLASSGANFGFRRTVPHMAGIAVGFVSLLWLAGLGLVWVFDRSPLAQQAFRVLALGFILWLAWRIATSTGEAKARGARRPMNFLEAAGFQYINPKALAMVVAIVSGFVSPDMAFKPQLAAILVSSAAITLAAVAIWTGFGVVIGNVLGTPARLRLFNLAMAGLLLASMLPVFFDLVG